ncbi:hypothetical protein D9611_011318 [Ephemerocybe angulata]|uniref:Uncharacterized protein n=1 Tax=Ephemerocybe angulata TaxID=980116 RepID=A0A8H5BBK7_9AGAR|nr:hypothetical protein D9611_011318 [Tulosesus angulatus]
MATLSDNKFCFKDLPVDLIRSIFEAAAEDEHEPNWGCARVSKAVHSWVAPRLYRHVFVHDDQILFLLHRTLEPLLKITHPRPEYDFQRVQHAWRGVQTLHFGHCVNWDFVLEILSVSSAASSIMITQWSQEGERDDTRVGVHPVWDVLRPKKLFLPLDGTLLSPTRRHFRSTETPMFANLTHFEFLLFGRRGTRAWEWASLAGLQSLTHMSVIVFTGTVAAETGLALFAKLSAEALQHFPPSLLAFIIDISFARWISNARRQIIQMITREKNDRVVLAINKDSYLEELATGEDGKRVVRDVIWRVPMFGRRRADDDYWARADALIRRRRKERLRQAGEGLAIGSSSTIPQ